MRRHCFQCGKFFKSKRGKSMICDKCYARRLVETIEPAVQTEEDVDA